MRSHVTHSSVAATPYPRRIPVGAGSADEDLNALQHWSEAGRSIGMQVFNLSI